MSYLQADLHRARDLASRLYTVFSDPGRGIFGVTDMPEDVEPSGVEKGSLEHLLFITLTVTVDYQRDADQLWAAARETFVDPETRYLFDPAKVREAGLPPVTRDMRRYGLSRKPRKDAYFWNTVAVSFLKK